jgi:hypothetical protein
MRASATKGVKESTIYIAPFLKESLRGTKQYIGYLLLAEAPPIVSQISHFLVLRRSRKASISNSSLESDFAWKLLGFMRWDLRELDF